MEKHYPLYQYSVFLSDDRNEQIVIRTDTWQEFLDAKTEVNKILEKRQKENAFSTPPTTSPNAPQQEKQQELGTCTNCGAVNKLSRQGKAYCSELCWKK